MDGLFMNYIHDKRNKKNIFLEIREKVYKKRYFSKEIKIQKSKHYTEDKGKKLIINNFTKKSENIQEKKIKKKVL